MQRIVTISLITFFLCGCATHNFNRAVVEQSAYNIDEAVLQKNKGSIITDELEGNFYYTNTEYWDFLQGSIYSHIRFTFHPGNDHVTATFNTMSADWLNADSLSVYIGKEKIIDKKGSNKKTDTSIVDGGTLGKQVYTYEFFDVLIDIKTAEKLAFSESKNVTLRFHTKNSFVDSKLHPMATMNGLKEVVNLIKATTKKKDNKAT